MTGPDGAGWRARFHGRRARPAHGPARTPSAGEGEAFDIARLHAADVAAAYERLGARVDPRIGYRPAGPLGPPCGFPLGILAAVAVPDRPLSTREVSVRLGVPWDAVMAFFGGFGDGCHGTRPAFADWPANEFTAAYRTGFTLAATLQRERRDLFQEPRSDGP